MNEKVAAEELAFIKNIINESRKSFALNGKPYIFWGILIVMGLGLEYLRGIDVFDFKYMFFVWIVLVGIGWGYAYIDSRKHKKKSKFYSLADRLIGGVWLASGISMTIVGLLATISGAINGVYVSPVISLILAIAYFVTGIVYDYNWQRNLSIGWWAGAIYMFFFPGEHTTLIMAIMMILLQIVPGIILLNKVKAIKTTEA